MIPQMKYIQYHGYEERHLGKKDFWLTRTQHGCCSLLEVKNL